MANSYNSGAINSLKGSTETLEERYSSNQLMNVLDELLERGIEVLVNNSTFIDMMMLSCLTWYSGNSRRKISSLPKEKVMHLLAIYPILPSRSQKLRVLRKLRLERNLRFYFLETFIKHSTTYLKLEVQAAGTKDIVQKSRMLERMSRIRQSVGADSNMTCAGLQAKFWYQQAVEFRNQIMGKYARHTVMKATSFYKTASDRYDLSDLVQNFQLALNRAINKFDQRKGTLTSYINFWLRHAQNPGGGLTHEYGIAYTIPGAAKKGMAIGTSNSPVNIFVSVDDDASVTEVPTDSLNPEESVERHSDIDRVRQLAKVADPLGIARIRLGIEEVLSEHEQRLLNSVSI